MIYILAVQTTSFAMITICRLNRTWAGLATQDKAFHDTDSSNAGSSVGTVIGYGLDDRGSRVRFRAGDENFLFSTGSKLALGHTQPPIQWVSGPGHEADHSLLVPKLRMRGAIPPPPTRLHWVVISEAQGQFLLYYINYRDYLTLYRIWYGDYVKVKKLR
jgi:hypothetical protein